MKLKPSRLVPMAVALLLASAGAAWVMGSSRLTKWLATGLWAAALLAALAPLLLALADRVTAQRRRSR